MFQNSITGQGTGLDQTSGRCIRFKPRLSSFEIDTLLRDSLVRRIVDARPSDISRAWRYHSGDASADWVKADKDYSTAESVYQADFMGEVYGGAVILPCFDDTVSAEEYAEPFNLAQYTGTDKLRGWMVYNPHQLRFNRSAKIVTDIRSKQSGLPETFDIGTFRVHSSWAIVRRGPMRTNAMSFMADAGSYFGESRLDLICSYVERAISSMQTVDSLMQKPLVDVFKMKTMLQDCADGEMGEVIAKLLARVQMTMSGASANRPILLDKDHEDYERAQLSTGLSGAVSAMEFFTDMLAAAGEIPKTRLLGSQTKGLANGGEGDSRNYYDSVDTYRERYTRPVLNQMDEIAQVVGGLPAPAWEFGNLWQESEKDRCDRLEKASKAAKAILDADVPFARTWVTRMFKDEGFYRITDEELDAIMEQDGLDNEGGG